MVKFCNTLNLKIPTVRRGESARDLRRFRGSLRYHQESSGVREAKGERVSRRKQGQQGERWSGDYTVRTGTGHFIWKSELPIFRTESSTHTKK